jgi:hypothetical protein
MGRRINERRAAVAPAGGPAEGPRLVYDLRGDHT